MLFFLHFYHNSEILEYIESINDVSFEIWCPNKYTGLWLFLWFQKSGINVGKITRIIPHIREFYHNGAFSCPPLSDRNLLHKVVNMVKNNSLGNVPLLPTFIYVQYIRVLTSKHIQYRERVFVTNIWKQEL